MEAGLLERLELVRSEPGLLRATRDGLRYAGLGLPLAVISPAPSTTGCAAPPQRSCSASASATTGVLTERELVLAEAIAERPIASATVGEHHSGKPRLHRPDLAVLADQGTIAIEVELIPKAPRRLQGLIRAWRRAIASGVVTEVHYHCAPGQTRRALERAVAKVKPRSSSRSARRWRGEAEPGTPRPPHPVM